MTQLRTEFDFVFSAHRPAQLGKLNERQVLRLLQTRGPLSRAELVRESGLSAPTVSRVIAALLKRGLLEETAADESARGRPAPKLRLAHTNAQVIGIAIDRGHCEVVSAGLDGELHSDIETLRTPATYGRLLDGLERKVRSLVAKHGVATLGLGLSLPGLVDDRQGRGVLSPNVPMTNNRTPARDLSQRLGLPCVLLQESHALCLAERHYGLAKGLDDFAMLDVSTGVGLGVMSGGRLLTGHSGLAGELGHLTVRPIGGRLCGCGNIGCLETVASDSALALSASDKLGRKVQVDEVIELAKSGAVDLTAELQDATQYLSIAAAAIINLFNPATLFIHTHWVEIDPALFDRVVDQICRRALPPSFADCQIVLARGSKRQGAVAGIIQHLTDAVATDVA